MTVAATECECVPASELVVNNGVLTGPPEWGWDVCPVHPGHLTCPKCGEPRMLDERFDEQISFEERAQPVVVTRLDCGHEIVTPGRWDVGFHPSEGYR